MDWSLSTLVTFSSMENTGLKTSVLLSREAKCCGLSLLSPFLKDALKIHLYSKIFQDFSQNSPVFGCSNPARESLGPDLQICPEIK